jgi:hypothetical protein
MHLEFGKPYHNKTINQCRAIGRTGGMRSARNRQRRLAQPPTSTSINLEPKRETAHEASERLDQLLPHLRNAWVRPVRRPTA